MVFVCCEEKNGEGQVSLLLLCPPPLDLLMDDVWGEEGEVMMESERMAAKLRVQGRRDGVQAGREKGLDVGRRQAFRRALPLGMECGLLFGFARVLLDEAKRRAVNESASETAAEALQRHVHADDVLTRLVALMNDDGFRRPVVCCPLSPDGAPAEMYAAGSSCGALQCYCRPRKMDRLLALRAELAAVAASLGWALPPPRISNDPMGPTGIDASLEE